MFKYVSVTTYLSFYYFQLIELHGERERERERAYHLRRRITTFLFYFILFYRVSQPMTSTPNDI